MTNDLVDNQILVYDTETFCLLQTIGTFGKGGVSGSAFAIKQYDNKLFAAVNNGSNSVSLFKRKRNKLVFLQRVTTSSSPVSIDFGYNHMYVAGVTTVDSFSLCDFEKDGTVQLILAQPGVPQVGNTSQISVAKNELIVTIKTDPTPGTVDVISLCDDGSLSGEVIAISAPPNTTAPFGFHVFNDNTALISLAHSNNLGLFRNNTFVDVISLSQNAPCWVTAIDKYAFTINAGSDTISRIVTTGKNIFVDIPVVAASILTGNPSDADQKDGNLVVMDHNSTTSHLNFFKVNEFGELLPVGKPVDLGVRNANGVAIM
ncbi:MAG: hypothetical protein Harvfovirus31_9 [Harvfovirus sp.]|uniref:Uncharacterized protein n=1 Tax=Harvfovirus sp. TaxID=2487768 RepID=A0A3G5A6D7_9VIRU|nr:MAG: hypothetical protein Harvfovirus31_9 [Harvfovirus sp.]